jgi:diketogulonate reductase-like aldo/keto reductase
MQLDLWGLDYFDLFLVHFPVALAYVDPEHRYPPEWWGDDKKSVNLRAFHFYLIHSSAILVLTRAIRKHAIPGDMGRHGRIGLRGTR